MSRFCENLLKFDSDQLMSSEKSRILYLVFLDSLRRKVFDRMLLTTTRGRNWALFDSLANIVFAYIEFLSLSFILQTPSLKSVYENFTVFFNKIVFVKTCFNSSATGNEFQKVQDITSSVFGLLKAQSFWSYITYYKKGEESERYPSTRQKLFWLYWVFVT